jgi:FkbM family methyltransferase
MKLDQLVSIRRYRRCRRVFRHPFAAHVNLARALPRPMAFSLRAGGVLRVPEVKRCRTLFTWLLSKASGPPPVSTEDGLLVFHYRDSTIAIRPTDTDFFSFEEVFLRDAYRLNDARAALDDVIDIGANIGLFTIRVAPFAKRVIAVEPVADNLAVARRNIVNANVQEKVTLVQRAMSDKTGAAVRLFLSSVNYGGHSICRQHASQWGPVAHKDVAAISLADLFDREGIGRCSLLKCDIEGAEFDVFRSASPDLLSRIDRIAMEVHMTVPAWGRNEFRTLCRKLETCGFLLEYDPMRDCHGGARRVLTLFAANSRVVQSDSQGIERRPAFPQKNQN